jgi:phosphoglycolate phosphatase
MGPASTQPRVAEPIFECVAFDFDGTLADTSAAIVATALQTLQELALPMVTPSQFARQIGLPLAEAFCGVGVPAAAIPACVVRYRELFASHAGSAVLFPGVVACLEQLAARGLQLAIVSSRSRASLLPLVSRLGLGGRFAVVLGGEDATAPKPAPELVLTLAARLELSPSRILVVGDTAFDIEMGHAAGARTCAVTWGNHDRAQLAAARPDHTIDSLASLQAVLEV